MHGERISTGANILKAIEVANALRSEFNQPLLDDLPKSVVMSTSCCILARAFNFNCTVYPVGDADTRWRLTLPGEYAEQAKVLADLLGTEVESFTHDDEGWQYYTVDLPAEIGAIARDFDCRLLPEYESTEHKYA